ncbi:hypothetical protein COV93_07650 [Candidatus Woesearchaeota archaeon CG11_big_fil_rev_8_21_14_0_20_43_8]|nr:MAG: hypothetical protein COV93_07650 [Candidatus Woesearchaeota archaeon CG11_big_fil_rev_8_21_14_0_20_43_8]PIO06671.1 MAG: hypothetical protein COT47_03265 [Candidatus Woesearchaeota archaeon CG08_land_8_20_14_0_20_43_7]
MRLARYIMVTLMLLSLVTIVHALSVAPALKMIDYNSGAEESVRLRILNKEAKDFKVLIYTKGDLGKYIKFDESIVEIKSDEPEKRLFYTVSMPTELKPGTNEGEIVILELPEGDQTVVVKDDGEVVVTSGKQTSTVSAQNGVISKVQVKVPYPGKFVQSRLDIRGGRPGEPIEFVLPTYSLGSETIDKVYADIEILSPTNERIDEVKTQTVSLPPHKDVNLRAIWKDYPNTGAYLAVAHLVFDDNTVEYKGVFIVGDPMIEVKNISVNEFNLGGVAKIDLTLLGKWNQIIPGVYVDMTVFDSLEETKVGEFKTASSDVKPYVPEIIRAYWDTFGLSEGSYVMQLDLNYGDKQETVKFDLYVAANDIQTKFDSTGQAISGKSGFLTRDTTLVILVIVLIGANIYLVVFVMKRLKNKRPPQNKIQNQAEAIFNQENNMGGVA